MTAAVHMTYKAVPTLAAFHHDDSFVRGVRGPLGSGKTSGMVNEILMRAQRQAKAPDGIRYSRWGVVRNTYPNLRGTTIRTWNEWVPPEVFGSPIQGQYPLTQVLRWADVHLEVIFLALERDEDVDKLRSFELTGLWFHEAQDITKAVFDMGTGRVDRYPPERKGGASWAGVVMDFNSVDTDHWLYDLAERNTSSEYSFYSQPPAIIPDEAGEILSKEGRRYSLNPERDNAENVKARYYVRQAIDKENAWIAVYLRNQYGFVLSGKPVHPAYNDQVHYAGKVLQPYAQIPLLLGFDFGLNPSCAFSQFTPRGQLRVIDELTADGIAIREFTITRLRPHIAQHYAGMEISGWGDPAGKTGGQAQEETCFQILRAEGFKILPAPIPRNDFAVRRDALDKFLTRMVDGEPGLLISSRAQMIRAGLLGKYMFSKQKTDKGEYKPEKSIHSHLIEGLQYICVGINGPRASDRQARSMAMLQAMNRGRRPMDSRVGY